jgi:alpha-glucosidase
MYLILDITPNHISFRHEWVEEAKARLGSPVAGYFSYNEENELETWLGVPLLIKLNYTSQQLRDVMYRNHDSALRYWLKEPYNIDGWRLDVANMMGNLGINQQGNEISQEMRVAIKQDNPDAYILGEHFHDATTYLQGDQFDAAMNYQGFNIPMRRWLGGKDLGVDEWVSHDHGDTNLMASEAVAEQWQRYLASIPFVIAQQQFNQLSNHDITRLLDVVAQNKSLAKLGTAILLTFIGVPSLYYGDEIGLDGWIDPYNRKCMPWDEGEWDRELFEFHQKLIQIRHNSHALKYGGFQTLYAEGDTLVFMRESSQERVIIVGYRGEEPTDLSVPVWQGGIADKTTFTDQLHDTLYTVQDKHLTFHAIQQGDAFILVE